MTIKLLTYAREDQLCNRKPSCANKFCNSMSYFFYKVKAMVTLSYFKIIINKKDSIIVFVTKLKHFLNFNFLFPKTLTEISTKKRKKIKNWPIVIICKNAKQVELNYVQLLFLKGKKYFWIVLDLDSFLMLIFFIVYV